MEDLAPGTLEHVLSLAAAGAAELRAFRAPQGGEGQCGEGEAGKRTRPYAVVRDASTTPSRLPSQERITVLIGHGAECDWIEYQQRVVLGTRQSAHSAEEPS